MEVQVLIDMLTEGLDDAEKATVTKAIQRDAVKAKASGLKAQNEFDAIVAERVKLQQELEGDQGANKLGARAYREWYEKNSPAITANDKAITEFDAKHGAGAFLKFAKGEFQIPVSTQPTATSSLSADEVKNLIKENLKANGVSLTREDLEREIQKQFQEKQAPNIAGVLKTTGRIIQRHMYAGRKNEVDFDALEKIMDESAKSGKPIDIETAYSKWDQPEREKIEKESRAKELADAVASAKKGWDEEQVKKNAGSYFPAGADATPGALSVHKGAEGFDKNSMIRDLARNWNSATDTTTTQ